MWYLGKEFDVEENKPYKTLDGGTRAARKLGLNLYDEKGQLVNQEAAERSKEQPEAEREEPKTEREEPKAEQEEPEVEQDKPEVEQDKPERSQEQPETEGAVNLPPETGNGQEGADTGAAGASEEDAPVVGGEKLVDEFFGVRALRISGKVRRVFDGNLRIRNRPSWEASAVRGVSAFIEKTVTHLLEVDGKQMYRTAEGYFISADKKHVEYVRIEQL